MCGVATWLVGCDFKHVTLEICSGCLSYMNTDVLCAGDARAADCITLRNHSGITANS